jgi:acyl dehydratase
MAAVLGSPGFFWGDPKTGADWVKLVHGEQDVTVYHPLPTEGTLIAKNRIAALTDKGEGKGALARIVRDIYDKQSGNLLATAQQLTFLRGDGGFSKDGGVSDPAPEPLPNIVDREPDMEIDLPSLPQSALIYRLSGDYNTLHADPDVASKAGFDRPILHGLCTYGMAIHAVLRGCCDYDATRLRRLAVRFTAPVYPGETVRFQIWRNSAKSLQLRARIEDRDVTVLNNGLLELN